MLTCFIFLCCFSDSVPGDWGCVSAYIAADNTLHFKPLYITGLTFLSKFNLILQNRNKLLMADCALHRSDSSTQFTFFVILAKNRVRYQLRMRKSGRMKVVMQKTGARGSEGTIWCALYFFSGGGHKGHQNIAFGQIKIHTTRLVKLGAW